MLFIIYTLFLFGNNLFIFLLCLVLPKHSLYFFVVSEFQKLPTGIGSFMPQIVNATYLRLVIFIFLLSHFCYELRNKSICHIK